MLGAVVRTFGTTSKNDVNILVAGGLDDGGEALLGDTHESVGIGGRLHGIDCDTNTSISSCMKCTQYEE